MKRLKNSLFLFAMFMANFSYPQSDKIPQLLQVTLQKENEVRKMLQVEIDSLGNPIGMMKQDFDSLEVTELVVKNDTLYYTTKQKMLYQEGYFLEQQVVALKDIIAVSKDVGIFLETAFDKLKIIRKQYYNNGKVEINIRYDNLFRTYFTSLRDIESIAYDLIKAFKKAGYTIEKGSWYD